MPAETDQYPVRLVLMRNLYFPELNRIPVSDRDFAMSDTWYLPVIEIQEVSEPILRHPKDGP